MHLHLVGFLFILQLTPSFSFAELDLSLNPCNEYEDCLKGFSAAVLASQNVSQIAKAAVYDNWQTLLDSKNLLAMESERVRNKSCDLESSLVMAPPESPLGSIIRKHIKNIERISGKTRDDSFIFESDMKPIRQLVDTSSFGFGMTILGAETPSKARELLKAQSKWEEKNAIELKNYRLVTINKFKDICLKDQSPGIKAFRAKLMKDHREIAQLKSKLEKIQEECQNIYKYDLGTKNRYESNDLSQGRYGRMKELAISYCGPSDAIEYVIGNKNNCTQYIEDLYEIVSPECEKRVTAEKGNLCNGLHRHLVKEFMKHPEYDNYLSVFAGKMRTSLRSKDKKDVLEMALESAKGDRAAAMRLVALVGHDEINTTMLAIREEMIRTRQFDRLARSGDTYSKETYVFADLDDAYIKSNGMDKTKGQMNLFKDLIRSGSPVGGSALSGRYYHYVAGASVACELKLKNHGHFRSEMGASLAGKIYEAFDFKSHISQGVKFSAAVDNFQRDTNKQDAGAKLGSRFCN